MKQYCYHILYLPARGSFSGILHVCHFGTYLILSLPGHFKVKEPFQ